MVGNVGLGISGVQYREDTVFEEMEGHGEADSKVAAGGECV